MIEVAADRAVDVVPTRWWRRPRVWIAVAVVGLTVVGGVITAVAVSLHYLHAPPLTTDGGGWLAPDSRHACSVEVGPYSGGLAYPDAGLGFAVWVLAALFAVAFGVQASTLGKLADLAAARQQDLAATR